MTLKIKVEPCFSNAIASFDWSEIYHENDTQKAYSLINIPKQKLKLKYNTGKLWLTHGLKDE